jgi:hypothetical protein
MTSSPIASYKDPLSDVCIVAGNGPSSRLIDYRFTRSRRISLVGMNSAYRYWNKIGVRPDYYVSIDPVVSISNAREIRDLIDENSIKLFVLADEFLDEFPEYCTKKNVLTLGSLLGDGAYTYLSSRDARTTGAWSVRLAAELRFKQIQIIGFDGVREEQLSTTIEAKDHSELGLKIAKTPAFNPNYFFSDYQKEGDLYQVPNPEGFTKANGIRLHTLAVRNSLADIKKNDPDIVVSNLSADDFSGLILKSSSLANTSSDVAISGKKHVFTWEDYSSERILKMLVEIYPHCLDLGILHLSPSEFYFGRPCKADDKEVIDKDTWRRLLSKGYFGERPTIYIKDSDIRNYDSNLWITTLLSCMRERGLIEFEISSGHSFSELISSLKASESFKKRLLNYPYCFFINQSGSSANLSHALKLALKDILCYLTVHARNPFSALNAISSQSITLNTLNPGIISSGFHWQYTENPDSASIFVAHGAVNPSAISIYLMLRSEASIDILISIAPLKTTPSTREKAPEVAKKKLCIGSNLIKIRRTYKHPHNVSRITVTAKEGSDVAQQVRPEALSLIYLDQDGRVYRKTWASEYILSQPLNESLQSSRNTLPAFINIEPDMIDTQGHYFRYFSNLFSHPSLASYEKFLVARKDLFQTEQFTMERTRILKTLSVHSWTIQTNRERFRQELLAGLSPLPIGDKQQVHIYMYTSSVFHILDIVYCIEELRFEQIASICCNLFWEMIKDVNTPEYRDGFTELREVLARTSVNVKLTAPCKSVQDLMLAKCSLRVPLAPHPPTAFSDNQVHSIRKSSNLRHAIKRETRIFFPGVNTVHKGYEYGLEIAEALLDMGYTVMIRPTKSGVTPMSLRANLEVIDLGISESEFGECLSSADFIVLPYMPSGFTSRTSGLIVDALFGQKFVACIENTWLASFVKEYDSGIILPQSSAMRAAALIDNFLQSEKDYEKLHLSMLAYHRLHSWELLISQITSTENLS